MKTLILITGSSHTHGSQPQPSTEGTTDQPEQQGTIQGSLTAMLSCSQNPWETPIPRLQLPAWPSVWRSGNKE